MTNPDYGWRAGQDGIDQFLRLGFEFRSVSDQDVAIVYSALMPAS